METRNSRPRKPRHERRARRLWHFITNQQNMLYILAAGLVTGPEGFPWQNGPNGGGRKYYADPLRDYPGWIPLFRDTCGIPKGALQQAHAERDYLFPCVASFDLRDVSATFQMLPSKGKARTTASIPARRGKHEVAALLRAPLPLCRLTCISFRSNEERDAFANLARDFSNTDVSPFRIEVSPSLFSGATETGWPPTGVDAALPQVDVAPIFGLALGGVLAMLYHVANGSAYGLAAYQLATRSSADGLTRHGAGAPVLEALPAWASGDTLSAHPDTRVRLFWGLADALVEAKRKDVSERTVDTALAYLDAQVATLQDEKSQRHLKQLVHDIRGTFGLGGGTIGDLFQRHKGPLSRALILFFQRDHCIDLLEFQHPDLTDDARVLAAILFGIRDTWLGLPLELRTPDLTAYVTYRMAVAEHRTRGDTFAVSPRPSPPPPLRALFPPPGHDWSDPHRTAALDLANECLWHDCLRTRVVPTVEGQQLHIDEQRGEWVITGPLPRFQQEIDQERFLHRLGRFPLLSRSQEASLRARLANVQTGIAPKAPERSA